MEGVLLDCPLNSVSIRRPSIRRTGFTLIELLVVVGIIVVLIGILLPVVSKIRIAAHVADTKNWVNQLGGAIDRYQQDFRAYPGPLANNEMDLQDTSITYLANATNIFPGGFNYPKTPPPGYDVTSESATQAAKNFTMSENLVLGLMGGLHIDPNYPTATLVYDASAVGGGPYSLSTILPPKRYPPYLDNIKQLSWKTNSNGISGHFTDDSGSANDCIIPCFVDRFTDPLPILYMRAKVGANASLPPGGSGTFSASYNPIVTNDLPETAVDLEPTPQPAPRAGQYDISQIIAYTAAYTTATPWPGMTRDTTPPTGQSIGIGKFAVGVYTTPPNGNNLYHGLQMAMWTAPVSPSMTKGATGYAYPYDAYPYLIGTAGQARQKDGYILIAAGANRTYGTEDDICNFGTVGQ